MRKKQIPVWLPCDVEELNVNPKHFRFLDYAADEAYSSTRDDYRLGAVVVLKRRIVSSGCNKLKTDPKVRNVYRLIHAEDDAINRASESMLDGATIYVVRVRRNGSFGLARPCPDCLKTIHSKGIRKVYYTDGQGSVRKVRL